MLRDISHGFPQSIQINTRAVCTIWCSHSGGYEECYLPRNNATTPLGNNWRFGGIFRLYLQGRIRRARFHVKAGGVTVLARLTFRSCRDFPNYAICLTVHSIFKCIYICIWASCWASLIAVLLLREIVVRLWSVLGKTWDSFQFVQA
jgi:hypothetical protein